VRFELGNPDLEPEHNFEADAGVRVRHPRLTLDVTGFVNRIERFIYPAATGDTRVVGSETLPVYEYTQADARLAGGELAVEWKAAAPVTARARADYVNGRNLDLDQPLAWVPPLRAVLGVEGHATSMSWAESARLGLEVEHVSEQTELSPLDTPADAYTLLHLDAGMTRRVGGRDIEIDLRVHNVADHAYRSFLSRYKRFADDPGRNVVLRLSTDL
jgi:outer membrane receptor protein involved in Fe transport